jgi:hypothetical protein
LNLKGISRERLVFELLAWIVPLHAVRACVTVSPRARVAGPEQVWLAFGATPDAMIVGWVTSDMNAGTTVQYGMARGVYT